MNDDACLLAKKYSVFLAEQHTTPATKVNPKTIGERRPPRLQ